MHTFSGLESKDVDVLHCAPFGTRTISAMISGPATTAPIWSIPVVVGSSIAAAILFLFRWRSPVKVCSFVLHRLLLFRNKPLDA